MKVLKLLTGKTKQNVSKSQKRLSIINSVRLLLKSFR